MEKKTNEACIICGKDQKFVRNFGLRTERKTTNAIVSGRE
jgi:ribosomal protein S14